MPKGVTRFDYTRLAGMIEKQLQIRQVWLEVVMVSRVFQSVFGLWLLAMFVMTLSGWRPPESILSEAGVRWAEVNLRPDMIAALLAIYGVGAATFLANRFVALGTVVQAPLAVNMALYHIFVNQILVPGGLIAAAYCASVAAMLWISRGVYAPLFRAKPNS